MRVQECSVGAVGVRRWAVVAGDDSFRRQLVVTSFSHEVPRVAALQGVARNNKDAIEDSSTFESRGEIDANRPHRMCARSRGGRGARVQLPLIIRSVEMA